MRLDHSLVSVGKDMPKKPAVRREGEAGYSSQLASEQLAACKDSNGDRHLGTKIKQVQVTRSVSRD